MSATATAAPTMPPMSFSLFFFCTSFLQIYFCLTHGSCSSAYQFISHYYMAFERKLQAARPEKDPVGGRGNG